MELAIKDLRRKLHMSQAEFADAVGVSMRTVGSWERGDSFPNAEQLWNAAVALKCTPNDILMWNPLPDAAPACAMTDTERDVLQDFRQSSPAWQSNIAATAKLAANESKGD